MKFFGWIGKNLYTLAEWLFAPNMKVDLSEKEYLSTTYVRSLRKARFAALNRDRRKSSLSARQERVT